MARIHLADMGTDKFSIGRCFSLKNSFVARDSVPLKEKACARYQVGAMAFNGSKALAEHDDRRVESRMAGVGRGFSATPERIAELQKRAAQLERQSFGPPTRPFAEVIGSKPAPPQSRREQMRNKRHLAKPARGPRPTFASSLLKERMNDELDADEKVVLKG